MQTCTYTFLTLKCNKSALKLGKIICMCMNGYEDQD